MSDKDIVGEELELPCCIKCANDVLDTPSKFFIDTSIPAFLGMCAFCDDVTIVFDKGPLMRPHEVKYYEAGFIQRKGKL